MKKNGFTLIELLAVIIILGVIALITVPLVIRMIAKSREDSAVRSAENYVAGVKKAVLKTTENSRFTASSCEVKNDGTGNLNCDNGTVLEVEVEGNKPTSGVIYFDHGDVLSTDNLKFGKYYISSDKDGEFKAAEDNTRIVLEYTKGDLVYIRGIPFLILKNSPKSQDYIVAIKQVPLTVDELNNYGEGIINRHKGQKAFVDYSTQNIGLMAYYNGDDCQSESGQYNHDGCTNDYSRSDVKKVVDKWVDKIFDSTDLIEINGYKARLITYDELTNDLHYGPNNTVNNDMHPISAPDDYQWIYGQYTYWTMSPHQDYSDGVWFISHDHLIPAWTNSENIGAVRPVVNFYKTAIKQ